MTSKPIGNSYCMTGVVSVPTVEDKPRRTSNVVVVNPRPRATQSERNPSTRNARKSVRARADQAQRDSHVLRLGVTLIIAALAVFILAGQTHQAAYNEGMSVGIAQANKADYTQAYDKGVADGYEKAKQEWQLSQ